MTTGLRTLVLDDDPTGTQCATDVTMLMGGGERELTEALRTAPSAYYETNTRSLPVGEATALLRRVRHDAERAAATLGVPIRFVLRGDSTLRGHVFEETGVFLDPGGVILFVPAFPEGGRTTEGGVHYLRRDGELVPVGDTEYAADPVFGYATSDLSEFVHSRSGRPAIAVPGGVVRAGGLAGVLRSAPADAVVIPDVVTDDDIDLIARAVEAAGRERPVTVRCAAPLAATLAGVRSRAPLGEPFAPPPRRLLVVCGSHTRGATLQLERLAAATAPPTVIGTAAALRDPLAEAGRVAAAERAATPGRGFAFIATERGRLAEHDSLAHGAQVMAALTAAAAALVPAVDCLVTKGGITSSEVIQRSAGVTRAVVLGQLEPGISALTLRAGDGRPLPCVVVPGNVGDDAVLLRVLARLGLAVPPRP